MIRFFQIVPIAQPLFSLSPALSDVCLFKSLQFLPLEHVVLAAASHLALSSSVASEKKTIGHLLNNSCLLQSFMKIRLCNHCNLILMCNPVKEQ